MKTLSLKEKLKDNLRTLQIDDVRQYHLTHDFYSGRKLNSNFRFDQNKNDIDHEVLVGKQDLDYINTLLYPDPTIGSLFADALSDFSTTVEAQDVQHQIDIKKHSDELVSRLKSYYTLYLDKGLAELLPTQSEKLSSASIEIIKRAYSKNTILVQNICILSEFWIRSPFNWEPDAEISLFDHLFVQYEAPACLKNCWNETATQENLQWLIAFLLYTQGGSVKQIAQTFEWTVTSNKLWHELLQVSAYFSPKEAVLYCEFNRLNGNANIYKYITANKAYVVNLLSHSNTVVFWYSMVRWLVINEEHIIGTEMARILSWARHQFTEYARAGKLYTMTGRSFAKIQVATQDYHRAIVARRVAIARRIELRRLAAIAREQEAIERVEAADLEAYNDQEYPSYTWNKLGISWSLNHTKWNFVELSTTEELLKEGAKMNSCVGSYYDSCNSGFSTIVSLRYNGERKVTIEIDPESRMLVQASGYDNEDINQKEKNLIQTWLHKHVSW